MLGKMYPRNWSRREWVLLSTCAAIAFAGIAAGYVYDTDTAAIIDRLKQDGTPARLYADASQCPLNTDLVFWSNSRSIPTMPSSISVCFIEKSVVQ